MKKYILILLILLGAMTQTTFPLDLKTSQENILRYLKIRKDNLALAEVKKVLAVKPDDLCALWAKAELLRRAHKLDASADLLKQILSQYATYTPALISLSYIRYYEGEFDTALKLLKLTLSQPNLERENKALAYMLIGSINAKRVSLGGFLCKITYGMRIKGFFEKAKSLAPDLSEVRLGLGSFYLLAPAIVGGNLDKAIEELEYAVELTPDFATANARLAQAYKKKGYLEKYNFYLKRAQELDSANEALKEIRG